LLDTGKTYSRTPHIRIEFLPCRFLAESADARGAGRYKKFSITCLISWLLVEVAPPQPVYRSLMEIAPESRAIRKLSRSRSTLVGSNT
jgi:hypothetical protein